jgi:hypothetical protein
MYSDGFVVAVILGVLTLLLPALWMGWWLLVDLGDRAKGTHGAPSYEASQPRLGRPA